MLSATSLQMAKVDVTTESMGEVSIRGRDKTEETIFIDAASAEAWVASKAIHHKQVMEVVLAEEERAFLSSHFERAA